MSQHEYSNLSTIFLEKEFSPQLNFRAFSAENKIIQDFHTGNCFKGNFKNSDSQNCFVALLRASWNLEERLVILRMSVFFNKKKN